MPQTVPNNPTNGAVAPTVASTDRPAWLRHCEQCLACIQWCPQEAIQFGKKTPHYKRYHHPEVTLQDMLAAAPTR